MAANTVLLDFDGTLTDLEKESAPVVARFGNSLSECIGIAHEEFYRLAEAVKKQVLADPKKGWVSNGQVVAPASADPYVLATAVFGELLQLTASQGIEGKYDPEKTPQSQEAREKLLQELFVAAYPFADISFRPMAKEFLDELVAGNKVIVVTNSRTDLVQAKLQKLGVLLNVKGDAKKYSVNDNFENVPQYILPEGFPRPVLLRRQKYYDVLKNLKEDFNAPPETTAVVGDIYELDLALPEYLGYRIALLDTQGTQPHERKYLQQKGALARDFNHLLEILK